MDDREAKIAGAAIRMFSRYGVKRTTMSDIAGEAGIVRQTLYNVYANKDEVLRATIRHVWAKSIDAVRAEWKASDGLGARLDIVFKHMVIAPFDWIRALPDADDIVSGCNAVGKDEIAAANEQYRKLIEEALTPHRAAIKAGGQSVRRLSDFIQRSSIGFKHDAQDRKHLLALLGSLRVLVLKLATAD